MAGGFGERSERLMNRYIPPDFDPKQTATLNAYQGKKHALGKRAKDIDKGILIVRWVFSMSMPEWKLTEASSCRSIYGAGHVM